MKRGDGSDGDVRDGSEKGEYNVAFHADRRSLRSLLVSTHNGEFGGSGGGETLGTHAGSCSATRTPGTSKSWQRDDFGPRVLVYGMRGRLAIVTI